MVTMVTDKLNRYSHPVNIAKFLKQLFYKTSPVAASVVGMCFLCLGCVLDKNKTPFFVSFKEFACSLKELVDIIMEMSR